MTNTLCVDIGNYSVLSAVVSGRSSTEVAKMRSLIYDCTHNSDCRNNVHPSDSPMIAANGKFYKLGKGAKNYPGFLSAAEAGKTRTDVMLPILLANTPDGFEGIVKILVPARDELSEKLLRTAVIGTHTYSTTANSVTCDAIANFTGVEFIRETDSAAKFAYESGVINPLEVVLIVDIGGGTCNYVVAAYEDDVFNVRLNKSLPNSGGIALAQAISNTDVVKTYGRSFEIAKIMDAITEGKTYISNRRDLSFETVYTDCVEQWFEGLISRIMAATDKYLDEVTRIVWCGGGTEIIKDKLANQPIHLVLENPQHANINGLIHSAKLPLLLIAA